MSLSNKEKREQIVNALYKNYNGAESITRKQVVAAVKDLPVPFPFWMTHAKNRNDDGTYRMPEPLVVKSAPGKKATGVVVAEEVKGVTKRKPKGKKKVEKKVKPAPVKKAKVAPVKKAKKEVEPGTAVEFDGKSGKIVNDLSTQYFVELEDGKEVFVFKTDKRLSKAKN